jgi:CHAT domain-containing protein
VLSPTGPLHALPLHALEIEAGKPLLERNPVVYSTSLSILRLCMLRRKHQPLPASPSAVIFGDPSGDRKGAADSATIIADLLNVEPKIGGDATKDLFLTAGRDVDMICFYGHAHTLRRPSSRVNLDQGAFMSSLLSSNYPPSMSKDASPLQDSIEFANKVYLEVREIFDLKLRGHVSLFACGSGEQTIEIGDEPSGLITALLVAGASSVLGTLWPIADDDGRDFSILFYRKLLERPEKSVIVNIAEAVRFASLKLRGRAQRDRPFNWASFVLHGAWFWKGATGEDEEGERNL